MARGAALRLARVAALCLALVTPLLDALATRPPGVIPCLIRPAGAFRPSVGRKVPSGSYRGPLTEPALLGKVVVVEKTEVECRFDFTQAALVCLVHRRESEVSATHQSFSHLTPRFWPEFGAFSFGLLTLSPEELIDVAIKEVRRFREPVIGPGSCVITEMLCQPAAYLRRRPPRP